MARPEHRNLAWKSSRELALDRERWAVAMRRERGDAEELPNVAVWLSRFNAPGAVIAESGGRREDRQKMILEGWRDAIWSGRYLGVRYDCASPSVAHWINRLAKKVGLTDSDFTAVVQTTAEQIAALSPAAPDDQATATATDATKPSGALTRKPVEDVETAPAQVPAPRGPVQIRTPVPPPPEPETAETEAERRWRYRDILGIEEPTPHRRWRH